MNFNKLFDVKISLGFGEFQVFHDTRLVDIETYTNLDQEEYIKSNFVTRKTETEYLPYYKWFWENIYR